MFSTLFFSFVPTSFRPLVLEQQHLEVSKGPGGAISCCFWTGPSFELSENPVDLDPLGTGEPRFFGVLGAVAFAAAPSFPERGCPWLNTCARVVGSFCTFVCLRADVPQHLPVEVAFELVIFRAARATPGSAEGTERGAAASPVWPRRSPEARGR